MVRLPKVEWAAVVCTALLVTACTDPDADLKPLFSLSCQALEATTVALEKADTPNDLVAAYRDQGSVAAQSLLTLRTALARKADFTMAAPGGNLKGEVERLAAAARRLQKVATRALLKHSLDDAVVGAVAGFATQLDRLELP